MGVAWCLPSNSFLSADITVGVRWWTLGVICAWVLDVENDRKAAERRGHLAEWKDDRRNYAEGGMSVAGWRWGGVA